MKHEVNKISKIVDEIVTFGLLNGTDKMNISIENQEDLYKIQIEIDNVDYEDKKMQRLNKLLSTPRQPEVEEYYWELAGESDTDSELSLVGIMVDIAEISFNGTSLNITLYRYK